jgi:hypothetical protein
MAKHFSNEGIKMIRASLVPVCLFGALLLSACGKPTVDVNLHGVNYTGDTFSYRVMDPADPNQGSGGELIEPFGAGGTMCCATLPREWRPGIKLEVRTTHWLKKRPDGILPEVKAVHTVEVPRYVDGKPGELWVVREANGSVAVISSDFQPNHPKWPGKVKGWPVPSRAYQMERWELFKKLEEEKVELYVSLLSELDKSPETRAKKAWESAKNYDKSSIQGFSGPEDPRFLIALRADYREGLERNRKSLKEIIEAKP